MALFQSNFFGTHWAGTRYDHLFTGYNDTGKAGLYKSSTVALWKYLLVYKYLPLNFLAFSNKLVCHYISNSQRGHFLFATLPQKVARSCGYLTIMLRWSRCKWSINKVTEVAVCDSHFTFKPAVLSSMDWMRGWIRCSLNLESPSTGFHFLSADPLLENKLMLCYF